MKMTLILDIVTGLTFLTNSNMRDYGKLVGCQHNQITYVGGNPNMRETGTNYFIFPGESGQDPEWLKGEDWRGIVTVAFEVEGKSFGCDPFVLVPHEAL